MSNDRLAVTLVGSGVIAHNHAAAIARHPRLWVAAVVDPDDGANERLAAAIVGLGGPAPARYSTMDEALDTAGLVVICTPSGLHGDQVERALAAGRHVVVEKPLDAALPAARRALVAAEAARARGQLCTVICQHRFDPASVAVAAAVAAGRFGRLTSAVASVAWWRGQDYYDSAGWRGTWELDGGGATMNQGVHTVDLLLWYLGHPVEVSAHTGQLAHDRIAVEDVAVATIRFASGALAVLHATTAAYPGLSVRLQLHGTAGSAVLHDDQLEYFHAGAGPADGIGSRGEGGVAANQVHEVVAPVDRRGVDKPADAFVLGHLRQYDDIVAALDEGREPGVTVASALTAMATVRAVYVSATLGRPVTVDDVVAGRYDDVVVRIGGGAA